jgi:hypothetical protein
VDGFLPAGGKNARGESSVSEFLPPLLVKSWIDLRRE